MGNRHRMLSVGILDSAKFLKMPISSQMLYVHLLARADDDGVVEAFNVMRLTGLNEDDLRVLVSKKFVTILNSDLVTFINDWLVHNKIRSDRKINSIYQDLLIKVVPDVELVEPRQRADRTKKKNSSKDSDEILGRPMDNQGTAEVKLSEVKLSEDNIREVSIEEKNTYAPTLEEIKNFCLSEGLKYINPDKFYNHYVSTNWEGVKDWKAKARYWDECDKEKAKPLNTMQPPKGVFSNYSQKQYTESEITEILKQKQGNSNYDISPEIKTKYPNMFPD